MCTKGTKAFPDRIFSFLIAVCRASKVIHQRKKYWFRVKDDCLPSDGCNAPKSFRMVGGNRCLDKPRNNVGKQLLASKAEDTGETIEGTLKPRSIVSATLQGNHQRRNNLIHGSISHRRMKFLETCRSHLPHIFVIIT
mmetsp:Transcript_37456/g.108240  ORF Transcript_37456/g.108240 Transcript_37456/m.108240 type:complete len:138 (+) Transcript_37456:43-456(+)